nr:hypothetical protein [Gammaproteobacteria bacterium]
LIYIPDLPAGTLDLRADDKTFSMRWFNPVTGKLVGSERQVSGGQRVALGSPPGNNPDWVVVLRSAEATIPEETPPTVVEEEPEPEPDTSTDPATDSSDVSGENDDVTAEVIVEPAVDQPLADDTLVNRPPEIAPIDDQVAVAGEMLEVSIVPTDPDGVVPSVYLESAPAGVTFPDNGAGGRTLQWQTAISDVGQHAVRVIVVDAQDNALTASADFDITIQPQPETVPESQPEPQPEPQPESQPESKPEPTMDTDTQTDLDTESDESVAPLFVEDAQALSSDNLAPVIAPLDSRQIQVGRRFRMLVLPIDPEGIVPALNVEGLPATASFADNLNGTRTLLWEPVESDIGTVELVFRATDARDPALVGSASVTLEVVAADAMSMGGEIFVVSSNQSPFFRPLPAQQVAQGQQLSFDVVPVDPEGIAPILHVRNAPDGATFSDNGNGTRKFVWQTEAGDAGTYQLQFVAIDQEDSALLVTQIVEVTVTP